MRCDGGVADTGGGANLDVSIPQSALRLPAPFPQGSRGCGTDTRRITGIAAHFLSLLLEGKALAEAVPVERKRKDDRLRA